MEFFHTHVSEKAVQLVTETLRSGRLSEGDVVKQFESALTSKLGLSNPVAVNSGTSALHLGLILAGVKPGDEVILPAITFVATGMAILYCGATPVFADVDPNTGCISPESVAQKITLKTKVVMPVHWCGNVCDLLNIGRVIHDSYKRMPRDGFIGVVEDAAHALGATYIGKPIGSISRYTAFSFQATKNLTTADGGCLCSNAPYVAEQARKLRWFGIDRTLPLMFTGEREFDITNIGYKYHMSNVAAALGLGNIEDFKQRMFNRRMNYYTLRSGLRSVSGIRLLAYRTGEVYYAFPMLVDRRNDFCKAMQDRGIPVSVIASRIDKYSCFGSQKDYLPGTDIFDSMHVALPCHEALTSEDLEKIIDAVKKGW